MRLLHIVPSYVQDPKHRFLGSVKDYRNRTEYFEERGLEYVEVLPGDRGTDRAILPELRRIDLSGFQAAIVEHPSAPRSLRYLRKSCPGIRLLIRSQNAEFFHRIHYARARWKEPGRTRAVLSEMKRGLQRLSRELICARLADAIFSITRWEADHYWRRLAPAGRVINLPYFLPTSYLPTGAAVEKRDLVVCLSSTSSGPLPLLLQSIGYLNDLLDGLEPSGWQFLVTGDLPAEIRLSPRLERTGFLESPFDILREARALALLGELGYGFKTKILDAIACGCWVLVSPRLYERLPGEVQPWCLVVDPRSPASLAQALRSTRNPPPATDPNAELRAEAFAALDSTLRL